MWNAPDRGGWLPAAHQAQTVGIVSAPPFPGWPVISSAVPVRRSPRRSPEGRAQRASRWRATVRPHAGPESLLPGVRSPRALVSGGPSSLLQGGSGALGADGDLEGGALPPTRAHGALRWVVCETEAAAGPKVPMSPRSDVRSL